LSIDVFDISRDCAKLTVGFLLHFLKSCGIFCTKRTHNFGVLFRLVGKLAMQIRDRFRLFFLQGGSRSFCLLENVL